MSYLVHIRRTADNLTRIYEMKDCDWNEEGSYFLWSDGNFGCDCNRALFFARAAGEDDPDRACGNEAFVVKCVAPDGTELYRDDAWTE